MFKSIDTVIFYVKDIEKSKKFYLDTLGFILDDDQGEYVAFKIGQQDRPCLAINLANTPEKVPGKQTVLLTADNIVETYKVLQDKKVNISKELQELSWGKTFAFTDIDGNKIEVTK